ncbi:hypothetical protein GCM10020331_102880 [Ectobacillus funiculus]
MENTAFKEKKNLESAKVWEKYLPILDSLAGLLTVFNDFRRRDYGDSKFPYDWGTSYV